MGIASGMVGHDGGEAGESMAIWNLSSLWCWWGIMVERLERVGHGKYQ